MKSETVVLLTGGSSGIGQCTARYLAEAGCRVYELSRRDSSQPGIIHLTCDVTREEQVQAAVKTVAEREGRIDIVVNNAGFGISGAVEFTHVLCTDLRIAVFHLHQRLFTEAEPIGRFNHTVKTAVV